MKLNEPLLVLLQLLLMLNCPCRLIVDMYFKERKQDSRLKAEF